MPKRSPLGRTVRSRRSSAQPPKPRCGLRPVSLGARSHCPDEPATIGDSTSRVAVLSMAVPLTTAAVAITAWILYRNPRPSPPPAATAAAPAAKPAEPSVVRERDVNEQARADAPQDKVGRAAPSRSKDQVQSRRPAQSADAKQRVESARLPSRCRCRRLRPAAYPAAPPPPAAAPRPEAKEERADFLARAAAKVAGVVVQSPDSAIRWRLIRQQVERSTDGGRTWRAQPTGTAVDLLAASAPRLRCAGSSAEPAWSALDGRRNVATAILPGRDGDLVGVTASDASRPPSPPRTDAVTAPSTAVRTWTRRRIVTRLQENPATPF